MEIWEKKNKRGRKWTGCLQYPYSKSLVTKYSKLNCSSSLFTLFPVVVFSKIKWFCRCIILWQLWGFLESWVKHMINRTKHSSLWLAFHVSKSWDLSIGKYRKWEDMSLNVYGTVILAMPAPGYLAEAPQITRLITNSSKELYWRNLREFISATFSCA